ncbi:MAG TPA: SPOR domain-containing protein [Bacteroidota bacterium]
MIRHALIVLVFAAATIGLIACSSEPATDYTQSAIPRDTVAPPSKNALKFETSVDTVRSMSAKSKNTVDARSPSATIRFMVQIGAFKDPKNATAIQLTTRDRYHLPVFNDFHPVYSLYQVRIGFFETYEQAEQFKQKMYREFPIDYKDSWVVQLKR